MNSLLRAGITALCLAGSFAVGVKQLGAQTPGPSVPIARNDATVGAKVLFKNDKGEILLVFDEGRQAWEVPGTVHSGRATIRTLIDEVARDLGMTCDGYRLVGLFTYHNPESAGVIVRPYYIAKFRAYIVGTGLRNSVTAKWFSPTEAGKTIRYPASARIVEKVLREPKIIWGGAFEEYGYTSPMTDHTAVKFRIIEDFYPLSEG